MTREPKNRIHFCEIKIVKEMKYVYIIIDTDLNWNKLTKTPEHLDVMTASRLFQSTRRTSKQNLYYRTCILKLLRVRFVHF